jgi:hypothetical protein
VSILNRSRRLINGAMRPFGLEISRMPPADADSRPISQVMTDRLVADAEIAMRAVAEFFGGTAAATVTQDMVTDFVAQFYAANLQQGPGSSGFNTLMVLFVAARARAPSLILESGTFQGLGSWALRTACPEAQMHCFDLSYENLVYKDNSIHYHQHDWASSPLEFAIPQNALGFFDDHVSHGQRIVEAADLGLKWLVMDDNVPWNTLHRDGLPPTPTISMLLDPTLPAQDELVWVSAGQRMNYRKDEAFNAKVRGLIASYHFVPNLYDETGYQSTPIALVRLR